MAEFSQIRGKAEKDMVEGSKEKGGPSVTIELAASGSTPGTTNGGSTIGTRTDHDSDDTQGKTVPLGWPSLAMQRNARFNKNFVPSRSYVFQRVMLYMQGRMSFLEERLSQIDNDKNATHLRSLTPYQRRCPGEPVTVTPSEYDSLMEEIMATAHTIRSMILQDRAIRGLTRGSKNEYDSMVADIRETLDDEAQSSLNARDDLISTDPPPTDRLERFIEEGLHGRLGTWIAAVQSVATGRPCQKLDRLALRDEIPKILRGVVQQIVIAVLQLGPTGFIYFFEPGKTGSFVVVAMFVSLYGAAIGEDISTVQTLLATTAYLALLNTFLAQRLIGSAA